MAGLVRFAALCLLLSVCAEVVTAQVPTCSATDGAALLYFYRELVFARSEFKTWVDGTNCCTWQGVGCDSNGNVNNLTIVNSEPVLPEPTGSTYFIGSGLIGLESLTYLLIRNVAFNGAIPTSWSTLTTLTHIELDGCNINGPLPYQLCLLTGLNYFSFPNNLLSGALDPCLLSPFSTFPSLKYYNVTGNSFSN